MIYRFALFVAALSLVLIMAGGLVTSTDSGLSVPDWPLSYGTLFPPMVGGIRFEHTHRMIAATVGILTAILAIWLWRVEPRRSVRWLGMGAFALVLLQALLGGLTVLWQLPTPVSVAHAMLGQIFFATLVVLAFKKGPGPFRGERCQVVPTPFVLATILAIFGQLVLGAILRHTGSGLIPHLIGAAVVTILILLSRNRLLIGLLLLQLILGALTFFTGNAVLAATAHVAVGALLLATSSVLTVQLLKPVSDTVRAYLELTKPRLTGLAVGATLCGFLLGSGQSLDWGKLIATLLGAALLGGGSGALNQVLEWPADAKMSRTRNRPVPSGRIRPESALRFGVFISIGGLLLLTGGVNRLAGALGVITLAVYLFLYTPLKSRTALCTLVGAIPGAMPPLIGWAAARGTLHLQGWLLFAILFLWQLPHFLAIGWKYRDDYTRAGFKMLPILDPNGAITGRQIMLYCLALIPMSLTPTLFGLAGSVYFSSALISGLIFLTLGMAAALSRSREAVHRLFLASVLYLPTILLTMTLDRVTL